MQNVWMITGASGGLCKGIAEAALRRGDAVALTSRSPEKLNAMVAEFPKQAMVIARPSRKVSRHKCGNCLIPISLRRCV